LVKESFRVVLEVAFVTVRVSFAEVEPLKVVLPP
jgi:hypothetical protein